MSTIPAYMLAPIRNAADARAFLSALSAENRAFHPDDAPESVGHYDGDGRWNPLFTETECDAINIRMDEITELRFDALSFYLDLQGYTDEDDARVY